MSLEKRSSQYLAKNLVILRRSRSFTQTDLAQAAVVPRSTINQLESGSGNPSLHNLVRLSSALQVPIEELLSRPHVDVQLIREEEVVRKKRDKGRVEIAKLLPHNIHGMEIEQMNMEKASSFVGVPHLKGTREYFICLSGKAVIHVAGEVFEVKKGEVLNFPGDEKHSYQNMGGGPLFAISVILFGS